MDFIAIDFETANKNYNSACSLGMVFVEDNKIIDEKYYLIQPPNMSFSPSHIAIHGITAKDVESERKFDEIWREISHYFTATIIVAHNAYFDMSVLKATLSEYNIPYPDFDYICSIPISNRAISGSKIGQSLKERTAFFNIELENHHNALDDARACAHLVIKSITSQNIESLKSYCLIHKTLPIKSFKDLKLTNSGFTKRKKTSPRSFAPSIKISDVQPETDNFDLNHPLYEKNVVFTGDLENMERRDAMQQVVNLGGKVKSTVSKNTDYLVVGIQDQKIVGPNGMSSKETKAIDLIHQGVNLEILNETNFLELIKTTAKI